MLFAMTSPIIDFDENAFINYVIERYSNNGPSDDIFDECFKSMFTSDNICENIRLKFYQGENYDSMSLHSILYNKVEDAFYDVEDSNADTEEFDSEEERLVIDEYDDY
jgi:hypothetical protein